MKTLIKRLFICATAVITLASCGGGNDVASGGTGTGVTSASAVTNTAPTSVTATKAAMDKIGDPTPAWVMQAYQQIFPSNPAGYTAQSLSDALAFHNVFAGQDSVQQVYNFAGFLANAAHESGLFLYMTELGGYSPGSPTNWSTNGQGVFSGSYAGCQVPYGGTGTNCYYGRGALQISHDYNYKVYDTGNGVYANPDKILGSGAPNFTNNLLFDSAVWFWSDDSTGLQALRPVDGFKAASSTYAASDPFGQSIKVINGGIECGPNPAGGATAIAERNDRIAKFISYLPTIAKAAGVQLVSGYSSAADGTIGVACTAGAAPAAFTMTIQNTGSTYASVILQAPDYSAYYYIGAGNIAIAPGATVTVGTTAAKLPLVSSGLNSAFPSTAAQVVIPRISIGTYGSAVDVTTSNPTNGAAGTLCSSLPLPAANFRPNTKASIVINVGAGTCALTNPS
ncbi:chitinase [Polynucleobacter sp. IMCC 29146]|uniref:chitinase n=1 Tax=Polynucleobacter sp. IMCC 29146 TaxID=2780953 RepID=UPI001F332084|nr:chitinase [Polynucleobacter sp. IMCC 29146]MCE7529439.1 chitinase [Polynucleobacter sp. IMCC 29146]